MLARARGRVDEAGEHAHGGGLAGAVGPEESQHLAGADLEAHVIDRGECLVAFGQVLGLYHGVTLPEARKASLVPVNFTARDCDRPMAHNSTRAKFSCNIGALT